MSAAHSARTSPQRQRPGRSRVSSRYDMRLERRALAPQRGPGLGCAFKHLCSLLEPRGLPSKPFAATPLRRGFGVIRDPDAESHRAEMADFASPTFLVSRHGAPRGPRGLFREPFFDGLSAAGNGLRIVAFHGRKTSGILVACLQRPPAARADSAEEDGYVVQIVPGISARVDFSSVGQGPGRGRSASAGRGASSPGRAVRSKGESFLR